MQARDWKENTPISPEKHTSGNTLQSEFYSLVVSHDLSLVPVLRLFSRWPTELYRCFVVVLIDFIPSGSVLFIELKPLVLTDQNNRGLGILLAAKS